MQKKILMVDDEKDIKDILKAILESEGYSTIEAPDGHQGFEKALSEKPDLIILDVMMPVLDGFGAAEKLKTNKDTFGIPIIMLTAKDEPIDKEKAMSLGVNTFIVKLFDLDELRHTVKELLG